MKLGKMIKKLLSFDIPDTKYELLETECGEPKIYGSRPSEKKSKEPDESERIAPSLASNITRLKEDFRCDICKNLVVREFMLAGSISACAVLINGMANDTTVNTCILREGMKQRRISKMTTSLSEFAVKHIFTVNDANICDKFSQVKADIISGKTAVFIEGETDCVVMDTRGFPQRSIEKPENEKSLLGSKEAFVENLRTNVSLIRKIVKTEDLVCEIHPSGAENKVNIGILYRDDLVNSSLLMEIKKRLAQIDTTHILSIGTLEQLLEENSYAPIPQTISTERPDRAASYIMQGHVVLLVDGSPLVDVLPVTLFSMMSSPSDVYARMPIGTVLRIIRYIGTLLSLVLPGIFLAVTMHHPGILSDEVLSTLLSSRKMVSVSFGVELITMLVLFQLVREAGMRIPGDIGQAISITGGLVLGQAAIAANLSSSVVLILAAITALGNFCIPNYQAQFSALYLRVALILGGLLGGLLGFFSVMLLILALLASKKSFGVPFLSPFAPKTYTKRPAIIRGKIGMHARGTDYINTKESKV